MAYVAESCEIFWGNILAGPAWDEYYTDLRFHNDGKHHAMPAGADLLVDSYADITNSTWADFTAATDVTARWVVEVAGGNGQIRLSAGPDSTWNADDPAYATEALGVWTVTGKTRLISKVLTSYTHDDLVAQNDAVMLRIECISGNVDVIQAKLRLWPAAGPTGNWGPTPPGVDTSTVNYACDFLCSIGVSGEYSGTDLDKRVHTDTGDPLTYPHPDVITPFLAVQAKAIGLLNAKDGSTGVAGDNIAYWSDYSRRELAQSKNWTDTEGWVLYDGGAANGGGTNHESHFYRGVTEDLHTYPGYIKARYETATPNVSYAASDANEVPREPSGGYVRAAGGGDMIPTFAGWTTATWRVWYSCGSSYSDAHGAQSLWADGPAVLQQHTESFTPGPVNPSYGRPEMPYHVYAGGAETAIEAGGAWPNLDVYQDVPFAGGDSMAIAIHVPGISAPVLAQRGTQTDDWFGDTVYEQSFAVAASVYPLNTGYLVSFGDLEIWDPTLPYVSTDPAGTGPDGNADGSGNGTGTGNGGDPFGFDPFFPDDQSFTDLPGTGVGSQNWVGDYMYEGDVGVGIPTPILWFLYKDWAFLGDHIVAYGQSLGNTKAELHGVLKMGPGQTYPLAIDTSPTVTDWKLNPAGTHAYDGTGVIFPGTTVAPPRVDAEVQTIEFVIPAGMTLTQPTEMHVYVVNDHGRSNALSLMLYPQVALDMQSPDPLLLTASAAMGVVTAGPGPLGDTFTHSHLQNQILLQNYSRVTTDYVVTGAYPERAPLLLTEAKPDFTLTGGTATTGLDDPVTVKVPLAQRYRPIDSQVVPRSDLGAGTSLWMPNGTNANAWKLQTGSSPFVDPTTTIPSRNGDIVRPAMVFPGDAYAQLVNGLPIGPNFSIAMVTTIYPDPQPRSYLLSSFIQGAPDPDTFPLQVYVEGDMVTVQVGGRLFNTRIARGYFGQRPVILLLSISRWYVRFGLVSASAYVRDGSHELQNSSGLVLYLGRSNDAGTLQMATMDVLDLAINNTALSVSDFTLTLNRFDSIYGVMK